MNMQVLEARRDIGGGYKVDVTRGERICRVSSEWYSRPHDERFLSLGELAGAVRGRAECSRTRVVESALIHVEANRSDPERLSLILPGAEAPVVPTHWSFGQLAAQVGAPAAYLRQLPAALAGMRRHARWKRPLRRHRERRFPSRAIAPVADEMDNAALLTLRATFSIPCRACARATRRHVRRRRSPVRRSGSPSADPHGAERPVRPGDLEDRDVVSRHDNL